MMLNEYNREQLAKAFLDNFFEDEYAIYSMPSDAGLRKYSRVGQGTKNYIFMDCPPDYAELKPFIKIAEYLRAINLVSPQIHTADEINGFLILEDFGTISAKDHILSLEDKGEIGSWYFFCVDILCHLQNQTPPLDLKIYSDEVLLSELDLFLDWYVPLVNKAKLSDLNISKFKDIWQSLLSIRPNFTPSLVLRDYHVENIMVLNSASDQEKLGLLDFQDALIGSPIYDLVSILEDARIKVDRELAIKTIEYYAAKKELDSQRVILEHSILGAQRNLRILGVFARKALRDKNLKYLSFIPLVLEYIAHDVSIPELSELKSWLDKNVDQFQVTKFK